MQSYHTPSEEQAAKLMQGDPDAPLQALIIDSWFDNYVGVVMLVRIIERARYAVVVPAQTLKQCRNKG